MVPMIDWMFPRKSLDAHLSVGGGWVCKAGSYEVASGMPSAVMVCFGFEPCHRRSIPLVTSSVLSS